MVLDSSYSCDGGAGWLWEMRSASVGRCVTRNSMQIANDIGHRFWRLLPYGRLSRHNLYLDVAEHVVGRFWDASSARR